MPSRSFRRPAVLVAAITTAVLSASTAAMAETTTPPRPPLPSSPAAAAAPAAKPQVPAAVPRAASLVKNRTKYRPATTVTSSGRTTFVPVSAPPVMKATAWAVVDMDTRRILGSYQHRAHLPQASTIKVLSAVTAAETVPAKKPHKVTVAESRPTFCTCAGLIPGQLYSRAALIAGMLLPSGNDAADALAGSHPQGRAGFVAAMNAKAAALGATDTRVVTPSGLTAAGAYSSARDLLIFMRAAQASDVVRPFFDYASYRFGPVGGPKRTIYRGTGYVNQYASVNPGTQGKSGYTTPAQNTLVVVTPVNGHRIGVATLGAPGGYSAAGARALTMWAAQNFDSLRAVGMLPPANRPVAPAAH